MLNVQLLLPLQLLSLFLGLPLLLSVSQFGLLVKLVGFKQNGGVFELCQDRHHILLRLLNPTFLHQVVKSTQDMQTYSIFHILIAVEDRHQHIDQS